MTSDHVSLVKKFRDLTGLVPPIRIYDRVTLLTDPITQPDGSETIALHITTYRYKSLARETRFTQRGTRVLAYRWSASGENAGLWQKVTDFGDFVMWEEDYPGEIIVHFGRSNTPESVAERRKYERDCHRPGTDRSPMDNFDRTLDSNSHPKMERHWELTPDSAVWYTVSSRQQ